MNPNSIYLSLEHIDSCTSSLEKVDASYIGTLKDETRRKESILARELLQALCINHLMKDLTALHFRKSSLGQPLIDEAFCSISHAQGWVFVGIGSLPFGLDIESMHQEHIEALELGFAPAEWRAIYPDKEGILCQFSAKEAISKLRGSGFTQEPNTIVLGENEHMEQRKIETESSERFILSLCSMHGALWDFEKLSKIVKFV